VSRLAAPRDDLTALLVDDAGALRAAFRANVEEDAAAMDPINNCMIYLLNASQKGATAPISVWISLGR
jgi:hypothetical protein